MALERNHLGAGSSTAPYRTLKIRYEVWDWDGSNFLDKGGNVKDDSDEPITQTYVEIIPDAALSCP